MEEKELDKMTKVLQSLATGNREFMIQPPELNRPMKIELLDLNFRHDYKNMLCMCLDEGFRKRMTRRIPARMYFTCGFEEPVDEEEEYFVDAKGHTEYYSIHDFII